MRCKIEVVVAVRFQMANEDGRPGGGERQPRQRIQRQPIKTTDSFSRSSKTSICTLSLARTPPNEIREKEAAGVLSGLVTYPAEQVLSALPRLEGCAHTTPLANRQVE